MNLRLLTGWWYEFFHLITAIYIRVCVCLHACALFVSPSDHVVIHQSASVPVLWGQIHKQICNYWDWSDPIPFCHSFKPCEVSSTKLWCLDVRQWSSESGPNGLMGSAPHNTRGTMELIFKLFCWLNTANSVMDDHRLEKCNLIMMNSITSKEAWSSFKF